MSQHQSSAEYLPIPLFNRTTSLTAPLVMTEFGQSLTTGSLEHPTVDDLYGVGFEHESQVNTVTFNTKLTELIRSQYAPQFHLATNKWYQPGTRGHKLAALIAYLERLGYVDLNRFLNQ